MSLTIPRTALSLAIVASCGLLGQAGFAQDHPEGAAATPGDARTMRVVDANDIVSLEIASRQFTRADGQGPAVALVGVAHIADPSFYEQIQKLLGEYDIVLYESVMPAGARGPGGESADERVQSTRDSLQLLAHVAQTQRAAQHAYPDDVAALRTFAATVDERLTKWIDRAAVDAWGGAVGYEESDDGPVFISLGADGAAGGAGEAADIVVRVADAEPFQSLGDDGIQGELARALGLSFQLNDLDYSGENWICSDMTMEDVEQALVERGVNGFSIGDMLSGGTLSGAIAKFLLRGLKVLDAFFDGAIADTVKVAMIEMLGDEAITQSALKQYGEGFAEVIVDLRNQVVVDDLAEMIESHPDADRIAILYGAAHMTDLAQRLRDQLGYAPADATWHPAISVDLNASGASAQQLRDMQMMMRQMMRMQMR